MAGVLDNIKAKVDQFKGKSGYGIGFSGAGPSVMDRVKGTVNVVKSKGVVGTVQSAAKGEKPILKQVAPQVASGGASGAPFFKRLKGYNSPPSSETVYEKIQSPGGSGRTEIRSRGN